MRTQRNRGGSPSGLPALISEPYRALNVELHSRVPSYGTGGGKWARYVNRLADEIGATSVLDYGCGKGILGRLLRNLDVREYDPAIEGKDNLPEPADIVVCTDVLEHVEKECLDDVLSHIRSLARKAALIDVCCERGSRVLADGRPAHITVHSPDWWEAKVGAKNISKRQRYTAILC